jgi:hypothetical protein
MCEHERTLFVVKMLERVGREEGRVFGGGRGKRKMKVKMKNME